MIFLTMTNTGYRFFAESQIKNFGKEFMAKHTLFMECLDEESYSVLSSLDHGENVVIRKSFNTELTGYYVYNSNDFKKLMRFKIPLILKYLEEHDQGIWFVDNDLIFYSDPQKYIDDNFDILFQPDMGEEEWKYSWVCTGCFWVNNTKEARSLLNRVSEYLKEGNRNEQESLNDICKSWPKNGNHRPEISGSILDYKMAKLNIFPFEKFQCGRQAFLHNGYKNSPVMIHFNHEMDPNKKRNNLRIANERNNYN